MERFKRNFGKNKVNLDDYGVVLAEGEGEPDDKTKAEITRLYGFNHKNAVALLN